MWRVQKVSDDIVRSLQLRVANSIGNNPSILLFGEHGSGRLLVTPFSEPYPS